MNCCEEQLPSISASSLSRPEKGNVQVDRQGISSLLRGLQKTFVGRTEDVIDLTLERLLEGLKGVGITSSAQFHEWCMVLIGLGDIGASAEQSYSWNDVDMACSYVDPIRLPIWWTLWIELCQTVFSALVPDMSILASYNCSTLTRKVLEVMCAQADAHTRSVLVDFLMKLKSMTGFPSVVLKSIEECFMDYKLNGSRNCAVSELLMILNDLNRASLTNPAASQSERILFHGVLPLQRSAAFRFFHKEYRSYVIDMCDSNATLRLPVLKQVFRYWPVSGSYEEACALHVLPGLIKRLLKSSLSHYDYVISHVAPILMKALSSEHLPLVFAALWLYSDPALYNYWCFAINVHEEAIQDAIEECARHHWSSTVRVLAAELSDDFHDTDTEEAVLIDYRERVKPHLNIEPLPSSLYYAFVIPPLVV